MKMWTGMRYYAQEKNSNSFIIIIHLIVKYYFREKGKSSGLSQMIEMEDGPEILSLVYICLSSWTGAASIACSTVGVKTKPTGALH